MSEKLNIVVSVEKINDISVCPRLYEYKHLLRKVPTKKADYLEEGELIHEGLRLYYQSIIDKQKLDLQQLCGLTRNYATNLSLPVDKVEQVVKDLSMYYNYYSGGESWIIEAVEEPFAKIIYEDDQLAIILNGKIDLRVKKNDQRILIDHKYESQFREKLDRDNQALAYSWAYETRDWIYNRIGKQKSYEPEKRLQRPYFNYTDTQINEWKNSTIELVHDLIRYSDKNSWPMRFSGCNFHGLKCTFYDVCNTTPDNREYKLENLFIEKDKNRTVMG